MTITAKHFNTKLNQWIHIDNALNNAESLLKEELKNTLLEYFLPNAEFSFGHMDETSTATELKNHPDGHVLLLSSKSRLLYGPKECLEVIDQLCPDRKDRGAYGSIFLGSCENGIVEELSILVIDDTTGRNGDIIDNEQARRLTGDCYGQISTDIYNRLTDREIGTKAPYRVIQHRFGWTSQDGDDTKFRFGKGTLRPNNLDNLDFQDLNNKQKIDLILPLSSFKGTDKDRPGAPLKPQIEPGLYKQKIWLGEKSQSQRGKTAISQMLASFPVGIKDFAEELEAQAKRLKEAQDDPRKLAALYCEKYEKRKDFNEEQKTQLEKEVKQAIRANRLSEFIEKYSEQLEKYEIDNEGNLEESNFREDLLMYRLIKADLMSHCQILETEKVQQELTRFVQNEWKDIAIGKSLLFERAMVIPSKDLKNGEICVPWYNAGEKVLNFRSPFLNSNGLCVSTNKVVEDVLGPNRNPLEGAIAVSDETFTQIYNRILLQVNDAVAQVREQNVTFNSDDIQTYLNTDINALDVSEKIKFTINFNNEIDKLNKLGLNIELIVLESEQERQGRDYDGDCIGFTLAKCYPYLAEEAEYRNQLENAYAPTPKLKKQSFYRADGAQPEFEEIAIHMSDGISVGVINNHLTAIEALESEIIILKNYSTAEEKSAYLDAVAKHYKKILPTVIQEEQNQRERNLNYQTRQAKQDYIEYMQNFVELASARNRSDEIIQTAFSVNGQMYRKMIQEAAFQNQIAVDLFKSAKKPDMELIAENSRYLYREVNYIKDKKNTNAYMDRGIQVNGYSPVEIIISRANEYFEQAKLESRPISQFNKLFDRVEFTHQDKLKVTLAKKEFDELFGKATQIKKRREIERGPYLVIKGQSGKQVEVTNLIQYNHPGIWQAQEIKFKIEEIPKHKRSIDRPHKFIVLAQVNGELNENSQPYFRRLGTLSQESENLNLKTGVTFTSTAFGLRPEISEGQAKILFQKASEVAENFYYGVPEAERMAMAAATWEISTTKQQGETNANNSKDEVQNSTNKVSNFVFTTFKSELLEKLKKLQFKDFTLISLRAESEALKPEKASKTYQAKFDLENDERVVTIQDENGEYTTLGILQSQTPRLPLGTTAAVSVALEKAATATAIVQVPGKLEISFKINEIKKFQYADIIFNGETVKLQIFSGKVPRNNEIDVYIDEKRFGSIDAESTQEAKAKGWIQLDKNGSTELRLKFKSIVTEGAGAYLIAETPTGNLLKINKINDEFKGIRYDDREFRTLSAFSRGYKERVFFAINNKTVGVLNNTQESIAALNALKTAGLFNGSSSTLPCKMQSNFTSCIVTVDSTTVHYPETWVKESSLKTATELNQNLNKPKNQQQIHSQIHNIITERPTILFQSQEDKMLGLVGLAVDSRKVDTVSSWLTKVGIEYSQIPLTEAKRESKKGLTVFMLSGSTIRPQILENLSAKFGELADATSPVVDIPIITEQSMLFYNPHQCYTDGNTNTTIQTEAYGLVVPAQDSIVVSSWLSSQGLKIQSFIENNCIAFVVDRNKFNDEFIQQKIVSKLGEAIDVSTVEGYEQYEQKLNLLNENLNQFDSLMSQANTSAKSEYQQIIDRLPTRPKELIGQRENAFAEDMPAAPQQPTGISSDSNNWVATQATDASLTDTQRDRIAASKSNEITTLDAEQPTVKQNSLLGIREIVAYGNQVTTRATSPQIPENPIISGKPVPMVYDLHTYDEPKTLPVNTTIDAMRGYGRVHTTRGIDYEKAYGIKEGDIAIAVGKDGRQVAFRVGKQYEISTEAIANPTYQQAWAAWEKHSVKELTQAQANKGKIYGLFMEPLGDYVNGKIVPFPALQQTERTNAPPTLRSQVQDILAISTGIIIQQVNCQGAMGAGLAKDIARKWPDVKQEYLNKKDWQLGDVQFVRVSKPDEPLLVVANVAGQFDYGIEQRRTDFNALAAKLAKVAEYATQYDLPVYIPEGLGSGLAGGSTLAERNHTWETVKSIVATTIPQAIVASKPQSLTSPVSPAGRPDQRRQITVISGGQTGADMGALIGAKTLGLPTGGTAAAGWMTEAGPQPQRLQEFGLVEGRQGNTTVENYNWRTAENIHNSDGTAIFGNANSPGSRQTIAIAQAAGKPILYVPLEEAFQQPSQAARKLRDFVEKHGIKVLNVAGNRESKAPGLQAAVTQIVQMGLSLERGTEQSAYARICEHEFSAAANTVPYPNTPLASEPNIPGTKSVLSWNGSGSESSAVTTDQSIDNWMAAAAILGKSPPYIQRIAAVKAEWEATGRLSDKACLAMQADLATLCLASELAYHAEKIAKILGTHLPNDSLQVIGKHYDVQLDSQKQNLSISDKNGIKILDIQQGKIYQQRLTQEVIKYFKVANLQIDSALKNVQKNLL